MQPNLFTTLFLILCFFGVDVSSAAPCCGGVSSVPSLILGDDAAQSSIGLSQNTNNAYVDEQGLWRHAPTNDISRTLSLSGAMLISDRFQMGAELPLTQRQWRESTSTIHTGDVTISSAYEALPEWSYSRWTPKGLLFMQVKIPTGVSIYDSKDPRALDVTGQGFWSLGLGGILFKAWGKGSAWDSSFSVVEQKKFSRDNLLPGFGFQTEISVSRSLFENWRAGLKIGYFYEDPLATSEGVSAAQKSWPFTLSATYLMSQDSSLTLSYTDQTLFGSPVNTVLAQTFAASFTQRWPR